MMKQKVLAMVCSIALLAAVWCPGVPFVSAAEKGTPVTLSDGSEWLMLTDTEQNTLDTDGEGRYALHTTAANADGSAFELISRRTYPLSSGYLMRCREASYAETYFGLTTAYSYDLNDENSIRFCRVNGYNGNENTVAVKVLYKGKYEVVFSKFGYTRDRYSKITVVKENGSYYLAWNGNVLNGAGCAEEIAEACKLENHFSRELLERDAFFHFYAGCTKLLSADAFNLQMEKSYNDGFLTASLDGYGNDANNSAAMVKANAVSGVADTEAGTYTVSLRDTGSSSIAPMVPVTTLDEEGNSPEFHMECYVKDHNTAGTQWFGITLSADPTFSDGTEKTFYYVQTPTQGVHCGYFDGNGTWKTYFGANNNLFNNNDPADSQKTYYFGKSDGKVYLYVYGAGLISKAAAFKIDDFSAFAGKPVYARFHNRNVTAGATTSVTLKPSAAAEVSGRLAHLNGLLGQQPATLEEGEEILAAYDADPYRYAVSAEKIAAAESVRLFVLEKRQEALKKAIKALKAQIDALPTPQEVTAAHKDAIKAAFTAYIALGDNQSALDAAYAEKLEQVIAALTAVDEEFAAMRRTADEFYDRVKAVGAPADITLDNFEEKSAAVTELRATYNGMEDFQLYIVDQAAVELLSALEERVAALKPAYAVAQAIEQLPQPADIAYTDEAAVVAARRAYNDLADKSVIAPALLKKLQACEAAVDADKLRALDWYSASYGVEYTGDLENAYTFASTRDKFTGDVYATTTKTFDAAASALYWVGMGCGSGQFAFMGLTAETKKAGLTNKAADTVSFILRPTGSSLLVTFFDKAGESEQVAKVPGFDFGALHRFAFTRQDGHWYLVIDGQVCDGYSYARLDSFMEQYGAAAHFFIGGRNGFAAANVTILDKNASTAKNGWDFSVPYGCTADTGTGSANLKMPAGTQAVHQTRLENLQNWSVNINLNMVRKGCVTYVGFLKDKTPTGNSSSDPDNGIVLKLFNRPAAGDNRTHILLTMDGKTMTYGAYEPAIVDADYFTLSVVKASDGHYYLQISWTSGKVLVKFDRTNALYRHLLADSLVENGAYFTVTTNYASDVDLEFVYEEKQDVFEDTAAATAFILELEKNLPALKKLDKTAYQKMYELWEQLDFSSRNNVAGDLLDDELAYNALTVIKNFQNQSFERYVYKRSQQVLNKAELEALLQECEDDTEGQYEVSYEDGHIIFSNIRD